MKRILITNDDGYESEGLHALIKGLEGIGHITVVAPASEKSACGHSLTLTRPLRFIGLDDDFYKLDDGTPSDCVYLALHSLFEEAKPDLIISGINKGSNMGEDITYSGTAAAAIEGTLHGIPSIAISQASAGRDSKGPIWDFTLAAKSARELVEKILQGEFPLPPRHFLNVNIPTLETEACQGWKVTRAGWRCYGNDAHRHYNPRGEEHYWLGLHPLDWIEQGYKHDYPTDFSAIEQNYISLSPIKLDMTGYDALKGLEKWL